MDTTFFLPPVFRGVITDLTEAIELQKAGYSNKTAYHYRVSSARNSNMIFVALYIDSNIVCSNLIPSQGFDRALLDVRIPAPMVNELVPEFQEEHACELSKEQKKRSMGLVRSAQKGGKTNFVSFSLKVAPYVCTYERTDAAGFADTHTTRGKSVVDTLAALWVAMRNSEYKNMLFWDLALQPKKKKNRLSYENDRIRRV